MAVRYNVGCRRMFFRQVAFYCCQACGCHPLSSRSQMDFHCRRMTPAIHFGPRSPPRRSSLDKLSSLRCGRSRASERDICKLLELLGLCRLRHCNCVSSDQTEVYRLLTVLQSKIRHLQSAIDNPGNLSCIPAASRGSPKLQRMWKTRTRAACEPE
jgi:hypothetical protein